MGVLSGNSGERVSKEMMAGLIRYVCSLIVSSGAYLYPTDSSHLSTSSFSLASWGARLLGYCPISRRIQSYRSFQSCQYQHAPFLNLWKMGSHWHHPCCGCKAQSCVRRPSFSAFHETCLSSAASSKLRTPLSSDTFTRSQSPLAHLWVPRNRSLSQIPLFLRSMMPTSLPKVATTC